MDILPDKKKFIQLAISSTRIPVLGEKRVPNIDPFVLFQELYKNSEQSFLLESGKGPLATAQFSIFGSSKSRFLKIFKKKASLYENGNLKTEFKKITQAFKILNFESSINEFNYLSHFWGGWVGFVGYEAGDLFEKLTLTSCRNSPDVSFMEVDSLFVYDHKTKKLKFILSGNHKTKETDYDDFVWKINDVWKDVQRIIKNLSHEHQYIDNKEKTCWSVSLKPFLKKEDYINKVNKAKDYISQGDIYQANLSQKFEANFDDDPFELYQRLRNVNPSPFSGFLKFKDLILVSSSPERLIKISGDKIESRPIAGTRPRSINIEEDEALTVELLLNEKERAEHLMLVDLERNDLGRLCKVGTVEVTDFMFLEKYSHVSHIVSNISGSLLPNLEIFDILKAMFPGGTITGCPKIRCMEIINELEPVERGPYSGSFGYIGYGPYLDLNIIIRSIVLQNGKASFHVGSGIVADSIPEKEYQETLDKAAALVEALS